MRRQIPWIPKATLASFQSKLRLLFDFDNPKIVMGSPPSVTCANTPVKPGVGIGQVVEYVSEPQNKTKQVFQLVRNWLGFESFTGVIIGQSFF